MLEEWNRFIAALPPEGAVPPAILESWERSRGFGVDTETANFRRVPLADLNARLAAGRALLRAAREPIEAARGALTEVQPHALLLTDRDGVILHSVGNNPALLAEFGLLPGYDWSERVMGTNGIGTALAAGRPVAVLGPEHYSRAWHNNTCVSSPIRDADGRIVGVLDLSTSAADGDPERLALVRAIVAQIEQGLAAATTGESA